MRHTRICNYTRTIGRCQVNGEQMKRILDTPFSSVRVAFEIDRPMEYDTRLLESKKKHGKKYIK